jgi:hypothetical protein
MFKRKFIAIILLLFLVFVGCSSQTTPEDLPKGIFYEVSGGQSTMYLFGSIHAGYEDMYPLVDSVESAFENSETLVLEMDLVNIDQSELIGVVMEYGFYSDGDRLSNHVSEETITKILDLIGPDYVDRASLESIKPWYAAQIVTQIAMDETSFSVDDGVDIYFLSKAADKKIIGLETATDQFKPFSLLSSESEVIFLEETLAEISELETGLDELLRFWHDGDYDAVANLRNEMMQDAPTPSYKAYQDAFLNERDANMAVKLDELLKDEGNYFVVVGYLHLAGDNSIPVLLEEMGYTVTPLS